MNPLDDDPFATGPVGPPSVVATAQDEQVKDLADHLLAEGVRDDRFEIPRGTLSVQTKVSFSRRSWGFRTIVTRNEGGFEMDETRWPSLVEDRSTEVAALEEITNSLRTDLAEQAAQVHLSRCGLVQKESERLKTEASRRGGRRWILGVLGALLLASAAAFIVYAIATWTRSKVVVPPQIAPQQPTVPGPATPPPPLDPLLGGATRPKVKLNPPPEKKPKVAQEDNKQQPLSGGLKPVQPEPEEPALLCTGDAAEFFAQGNQAHKDGDSQSARRFFEIAATCSPQRYALKVGTIFDPISGWPTAEPWKSFYYYRKALQSGDRKATQRLFGLRDWAATSGEKKLRQEIDEFLRSRGER